MKKKQKANNIDKTYICSNHLPHIQTSTIHNNNRPQFYSRISRWLNFDPKRTITAVCLILLIIWCFWWGISFKKQELLGCKYLLFGAYPAFGIDFYGYIDLPARIWWNNGDPYANKGNGSILFVYPPSEMRLFAWVNFMKPRTALGVWQIIMTVIIAASAWIASKWRNRLYLKKIPPLIAIILILFSTPVLFALERGQYDPLSLLFILAALPLLYHPSKWIQFFGGSVLCIPPWIKIYPGLLFVGLIGLKRWRALAGFVIFGLIILASLNHDEIIRYLVNNSTVIQIADKLALFFHGKPSPWNHPLTTSISSIWLGTKFNWLGLLPSKIIGIVLLSIPLIWVTYHIYKCPRRKSLTYPYLLWIVSLATFVPQVSNDYNFCFLPLAVISIWNHRDPLLVQILLFLLLLWWQPVNLFIPGMPLLIIKLLGLYAVAYLLIKRAGEQGQLISDSVNTN